MNAYCLTPNHKGVSYKKEFLQNSQENTCARVTFITKPINLLKPDMGVFL